MPCHMKATKESVIQHIKLWLDSYFICKVNWELCSLLSEKLASKSDLLVSPFVHYNWWQETVNKVPRVKRLPGLILCQAHTLTSCNFWKKETSSGRRLADLVAWRLLLLRSLRDGLVSLGLCVVLLICSISLTLSISIARFFYLSLRLGKIIRRLFTPVRLF
jgi:hypothetical protein